MGKNCSKDKFVFGECLAFRKQFMYVTVLMNFLDEFM